MKPRSLLIPGLLAVSMAAFIVFYEKDLPSTDERAERANRVLGLQAEEVVAIELSVPGEGGAAERTLRLERAEPEAEEGTLPGGGQGAWHLVEPIRARADSAAVIALVDRIAGLEKKRDIADFEAADLGFDRPRAVAVLHTETETRRLEIGNQLALSGDVAVRSNEPDLAFQVSAISDLASEIGRPPNEWRDKRLFIGHRSRVETLSIFGPEADPSTPTVALARRPGTEIFDIVTPISDRAETSETEKLLGSFVALEAEDFLDGIVTAGTETDGAVVGGTVEAPGETETLLGSFEIRLEDSEDPWRLELFAEGVAMVDGQRVRIDARDLQAFLDRDPESWRSTAWTTKQVFALEWARFDSTESSFEVVRDRGEWRRGEDNLDYSVVTDALYPITEMRAVELISASEAARRGFDLDHQRLKVTLGTTTEEEHLLLHGSVAELAAASLDGRDTTLLLPLSEVESWLEAVAVARAAPARDASDTSGPDPRTDSP